MSPLSFDIFPSSPGLAPLLVPLSPGHERVKISNGDKGTAETIELMQKLVSTYKREDITRELLGKMLHGGFPGLENCAQKDYYCYARNIYLFYRDYIKYVYDPHLVEYIERPKILIKNRIGDCDSKVIAMVATWEAAGLEAQFVTIKSDIDRPKEYSHVYARVKVPKHGWIVADPTMPRKDFGWEPETFFFRKYWHGSSDSVNLNVPIDTQDSVKPGLFGMMGMGGLACGCKKAMSGLGVFGDLGRHRRGGWRGGWGGGWYGGPAYIPYPVYLTPDQVANAGSTDSFFAAQEEAAAAEAALNPEYNVGATGAIGMGELGATKAQQETTVLDVANGNYLKRLQQMTAMDRSDAEKANNIFAAIQKMPMGAQRAQAQAAYDKGNNALIARMKSLAQAKKDYNELVGVIRDKTGGLYKPALAGLGAAFIPIALIVAAAAFLIDRLTGAIGAWNGNKTASDGYMDQAARLAQQAGVLVEKTADAAVKFSTIAALAIGGYLIYQNRAEIRKAVSGVGARFSRARA